MDKLSDLNSADYAHSQVGKTKISLLATAPSVFSTTQITRNAGSIHPNNNYLDQSAQIWLNESTKSFSKPCRILNSCKNKFQSQITDRKLRSLQARDLVFKSSITQSQHPRPQSNLSHTPQVNKTAFEAKRRTISSFQIKKRGLRQSFDSLSLQRHNDLQYFSEPDTENNGQNIAAKQQKNDYIQFKSEKRASPAKENKNQQANVLKLHQISFKQWFKTHALSNTHSHYHKTGAEIKSDNIIDDMFKKLDQDGGGTLDCAEIASLFKENGIHMSIKQIANMFGEANRANAISKYNKLVQSGCFSKTDSRIIQKKPIDFYLSMQMDPDSWKEVTKSTAALKSFKRDLKSFRNEMLSKKQTFYIPVTMDELMARFVTNMERDSCEQQFNDEKSILFNKNYNDLDNIQIESGVRNSFKALKDLLSNNTIDQERQPNSENCLYLKLIEKAQDESKLSLINMKSSKYYHLIKTKKPQHLL